MSTKRETISQKQFLEQMLEGRKNFENTHIFGNDFFETSENQKILEQVSEKTKKMTDSQHKKEQINISGSHLIGVELSNINLPYIKAIGTKFENCTFEESVFDFGSFVNSKSIKTSINECSLKKANLKNIGLYQTHLKQNQQEYLLYTNFFEKNKYIDLYQLLN